MARAQEQVVDRASRGSQSREVQARKASYVPPSLLPFPTPESGWRFRYVRKSFAGQQDDRNIGRRRREGWVFCRPEDYPEISALSDLGNAAKDYIEFGGQILAKLPEEIGRARDEYYASKNSAQINSVDNTYFSLNDRGVQTFRDPESRVFVNGRR